eukprot:16429658-Heterocapsa_arctica.AAC.1
MLRGYRARHCVSRGELGERRHANGDRSRPGQHQPGSLNGTAAGPEDRSWGEIAGSATLDPLPKAAGRARSSENAEVPSGGVRAGQWPPKPMA